MLQLYDINKVKIKGLKQYKDYCVESVLSSGDKTLSFLYPARLSNEIKEEGYIRTKTDEFVIKEITGSGDWKSIKARLNVDELEGKPWEHFDTTEKTITECLTLALTGTGWTVGTCNVTKRRTVRKTNCSSWGIIQEAKKVYAAEMQFDTLNKKINIAEKLGSDKGVYFMDSLNLKTLDVQGNSYDFYTRIIAIGKDGLKVTVENFQYSNKKKTFIWKDERYTDIASLTEDATLKLNELSKPYRSYGADIIDLANISDKYSILSYGLGDTITLISKDKGIREKQRIVKITEYTEEPHRNSCEIANGILSFVDTQKEFKDTSDTVSNITTDNGTIDGEAINGITTDKITDFEASVGKVANLTVVNARIDNLYAEKADIGSLNAVIANIGELNATKANITDLTAINANISNLQVDKASIIELNAVSAKINVLEVDTADIKTLLAGNITGGNIQAGGITSDKLTIVNGFIKNAMIDSLDVNKINAGIISTSKFQIKSDDGGIEIVGATQQFKDKNNKVRIQMGKDSKGDFNFIIRGEDGTTTLIDHTGVKAKAIADNLIVDNMIAPDAVGEKQINYNSFTTGFNKDTNTSTLNSSKVLLDGTSQTLNVAFNSLSTTVNGVDEVVTSHTTTLNVQQGKIDTLISNTTITKDGKTTQLKDEYNSTVATVNSINSTIGKHTSSINALTGQVTGVDTKVNSVKRDLDGTVATVSGHTTQINGLNSTVSTANSEISQLKNKIALKVEQTDIDKSVSNVVIGGRNLFRKSGNFGTTVDSGYWVNNGGGLTVDTANQYNGYNTIKTTVGTGISGVYYTLENNVEYTYSAMVKCDTLFVVGPNTPLHFHAGKGHNNQNKITTVSRSDNYTEINKWQRIYVTFKLTQDADSFRPFIYFGTSKNLTMYIANLQLEKGNKPTDWTPAPEDTDKAIADTITITEEKIKSAKAEIKLETDRINLEVGKTNSIVTSHTTSINAVDGKINTAKGQAVTESVGVKDRRSNNDNPQYYFTTYPRRTVEEFKFASVIGIPNAPASKYGICTTIVPWTDKSGGYPTQTFRSDATPTFERKATSDTAWGSWVQIEDVTGSQNKATQALNTSKTYTETKVSDAKADIKLTTDSITQRVSNTESTTKTIDGKVIALDTRLKAAEIKITDKSIISTVTATINTAKTEAINSANTNTANSLKNYSTTSSMNSAITQSATGIKQEVSNTYMTSASANSVFATKSSMELTDSQLRLDFTSSGGYNLISNSMFANTNMSNWATYRLVQYTSNAGYFTPYKGSIALALIGNTYGYFYQGLGNQLARNTVYTFSGTLWWESKISAVSMRIEYFNGSAYVGEDIINLTNSSERKSYTFTTRNIDFTHTEFRIYASNPTSASGNIVTVIEKPCLVAGNVAPYSPNPNEVIDGNTQIDAGGVTIFNGALTVKNKAGATVISADSNGNLAIQGKLSTDPNNPILRMFNNCSIDATANNEQGVGTAVRFKWDNNDYIRVATGVTDIYQGGALRHRFLPNAYDMKCANIYLADQCKIDASGGTLRMYISKSADTGISIQSDGQIRFMVNGSVAHRFNPNGTKSGGTIKVDGVNLGMSPIDSPKILLEDVLFNVDVEEQGTTINLNGMFLKTISTYAVFCSNPNVVIESKDRFSFYVKGYTGKADFRIVGHRIGHEGQYYQIED